MIRLLRLLMLALTCLWLVPSVNAMPQNIEIEPVALTPESAASFVDGYVAANMEAMLVPGTAIVIVQNGELIHAGGYGLANVAANHSVSVAETIFRVGSVSKLFTATAVMQLVEQGAVDLDRDVNHYLNSVQIPANDGDTVTVRDLLLHTAGFDEPFIGMHARRAEDQLSLPEVVQTHMPGRYIPAGTLISYNDYGYALAGLVVEDVSGQRFEDYVAANILLPLQMQHSSFHQPNPMATEATMAVGYRHNGGAFQPYELDVINSGPAVALTGTATDMANFMLAHLDLGRFDETQILAADTASAMQQRQVANHPALRGRGIGFSEWQENGHRAIFHDGGSPGFLNRMMLLPEQNVGFFITFNGDQFTGATRFHREFTTQFFDTFFPEQAPPAGPSEWTALSRPAADFTGYYRETVGYSRDTIQKIRLAAEAILRCWWAGSARFLRPQLR